MTAPRSSTWLIGALLVVKDALAHDPELGEETSTQSMNSTKQAQPMAKVDPPDTVINKRFALGLLYTWIILIVLLTIYNFGVTKFRRYSRKLACLDSSNQAYFKRPPLFMSRFKKHLVDAPIFKKRHHREITYRKGKINVGAIPNRPQALFVGAYLVTMVALTFANIDYSKPERYIHYYLMKRTGTLVIINLLPLFLLAGRNNPLIPLLGITFDTYNLIHRWIGRTVIAEALIHVFSWVTKKVHAGGWQSIAPAAKAAFVQQGLTAATAVLLLLITTPAPFRKAFYETFLHIHQVLAITLLAALWFHTAEYSHHRKTLIAIVVIWATERSFRVARILYYNVGNGGTQAELSTLPGGAVLVKMKLARSWRFTPGQHAYIYIPRIGYHTSHPFSVIWCNETDQPRAVLADVTQTGSDNESTKRHSTDDTEKKIDPEHELQIVPSHDSNNWDRKQRVLHFIVRPKAGFTGKLMRKAKQGPLTTTAFVEGPYNEQKLHSYGTVILFAAGVGITHALPHVKDLVEGYGQGTVAARKVVLFWALMSPDCLEWIREYMEVIMRLPGRAQVLKVVLYIFSGLGDHPNLDPSVEIHQGIPSSEKLLDGEIETAVGTIGVSVCGIGAMADDVRFACRKWMTKVNIDLEEESFSW